MDLDAKLAQLKIQYIEQLPSKIGAITEAWRQLIEYGGEEQRFSLYRLAHSLAGSGATYGFPALSESARRLEDLVNRDASTQRDELKSNELELAIGELTRVANEIALPRS